ncbi:glucose 1-dehydrogenase [Haliea sp. E1-2-M8]|uniref:SDR family NAD(P)-dependent oxidoreductase n=1 Tax=Haliea sp. E1-2-M8 TaxID=3064706 RepID=UPI00271EDAFB|nr:glucose 1-dehydrogenase [Haliea sp. E1-2-M8]MDO8863026.1 glucose 1-dehydrogenase [Haliea sp. E1-2-M8]
MSLSIDLADKVAIVTGAGMGIGEGVALALARAGAHVVCNARTARDIDETAAKVRACGVRALAVPGDVTVAEDLDRLVSATIQELGRIDILINNAGGTIFNGFLDISDEEFSFIFDWNTKSAFMLSKRVAPYMIKQGSGVIINVSSAVGHLTGRGMMAYGVAKAGLDYLTRSLADELAPRVRVNAIALGSIMTPALRAKLIEAEASFGETLIEKTPLRSIGDADKVGETVAFLCSPAADYITGDVLRYDGGLQDTNLPFRLPDYEPDSVFNRDNGITRES